MSVHVEAADPSLSALVDRLAQELNRRWHAGERPHAEEYLARHPDLAGEPAAAVELIYEELCCRQELGEAVSTAEIVRRFPQWHEQVRLLIDCHRCLESGRLEPTFPEAGDTVAGFRLVSELGRGGQGRVFLATETALADRPVVVKLTAQVGQEHLSLARLQHTHIVPLYGVRDDPTRKLRILCMPYFGGATLHKILDVLHDQPLSARTGTHVVEAIQQLQPSAGAAALPAGPARQFLARLTYVRATCWMGACLADALHFAHGHNLLHLDVKPSNVLWAADGEPMLLDLHLARAPLAAGTPAPRSLGGTPTHLAPEHRRALHAVSAGTAVPMAVDARADVYGMGLVLAEALTGCLPPKRRTSKWLRQQNPHVTCGLADVVQKCLAEDPEDRYQTTADLATDLRCHLADLPLRGVANRSVAERWHKWRRRRPYGPVWLGLVMVLLVTTGLSLTYVAHEAHKSRNALQEGLDHLERHDYGRARAAFERGLAGVDGLPFQGDVADDLRQRLQIVDRVEIAHHLHAIVERIRNLYGADGQDPTEARAVESLCHAFWAKRLLIRQELETGVERDQVQVDLLDLAILWTDLRVQLAAPSALHAIHQEALETLAEAERWFTASCVLASERRLHLEALDLPVTSPAATPGPRTAWEHFAVGRADFRAGRFALAEAELDRALALQPQAFWPNVFKGKCAYQRGAYDDAILAFTACVVLAPESAWCYHNRGLAFDAQGQSERALRDYGMALRLNPTLALAALHRGMLHARGKRYGMALEDLEYAQDQGAPPATVYYHRALVALERRNRPAALGELEMALKADPNHAQAAILIDRLRQQP